MPRKQDTYSQAVVAKRYDQYYGRSLAVHWPQIAQKAWTRVILVVDQNICLSLRLFAPHLDLP